MEPLQVHCFLDCFTYLLRTARNDVDCRPMYFGAWNVPVYFDKRGELTYYSEDAAFVYKFNNLYGDSVKNWIQYPGEGDRVKRNNFLKLVDIARRKREDEGIVVVVDLFYLDYPNRCYQMWHRPHIVIVEGWDEEGWRVVDPYYSWSGKIPESDMAKAFSFEEMVMGLSLSRSSVSSPTAKTAIQTLDSSTTSEEDELSLYLEDYFEQGLDSDNAAHELSTKFIQLGVLTKRKLAYRYAFTYLYDTLDLDPQPYEADLAKVLKGWGSLGFLIAKLGVTLNANDLVKLQGKIRELIRMEKELKEQLHILCQLGLRKLEASS